MWLTKPNPKKNWIINNWFPKLTEHLEKTRPDYLYTRTAKCAVDGAFGIGTTVIRRRRKLLPCVVTS